ncbi:MAG: ABC transporter ATP-binding protein, partial [Bdellovibrionales bacterium]|nr:ABC transporter ATP-binding protein [Bdellovibrionales bacterium]
LKVYEGESFGFLGHNGAGKTTTIKCIIGLIHKTSGRILIHGTDIDPSVHHAIMGYLPEHPYFYDHLTVLETLDFFAALHGYSNPERRKKVIETLEVVGLADRQQSSVRSLSKGLQQRLGFAQAIINKPKLLLLDEPFSGLDPLGRLEIRNLILDLKKSGTTIFMSSHILSDVEDICDRVSIMTQGVLRSVFSLADRAMFSDRCVDITVELQAEHIELREQLESGAVEHDSFARGEHQLARYSFPNYKAAVDAARAVFESGAVLVEFQSSNASLEEIFMDITRAARDKTNGKYHN